MAFLSIFATPVPPDRRIRAAYWEALPCQGKTLPCCPLWSLSATKKWTKAWHRTSPSPAGTAIWCSASPCRTWWRPWQLIDSGGLCLGIDFMVQNMNDSYHLLVPCASKGNCFETLLFSSSVPKQKMTFQSQVQHHIFEFFQGFA